MAKVSPLFGALERLARSGGLDGIMQPGIMQQGASAMGMFGGGGGGGGTPAAVPAPIKPVPLPDPEDPAILAERRRQLLRAAGSSGRASTTLQAQEDYSSSKTGVASAGGDEWQEAQGPLPATTMPRSWSGEEKLFKKKQNLDTLNQSSPIIFIPGGPTSLSSAALARNTPKTSSIALPCSPAAISAMPAPRCCVRVASNGSRRRS